MQQEFNRAARPNLTLPAFQGPFELLFHLIEKNQINIYDIPMAELTDQYVEIIKGFPEDMEFISEFILMAATLLEIKSRMLLPKPSKEEKADPREKLVELLLEYKKFKNVARALSQMEREAGRNFYREPETKLFDLLKIKKNIDLAGILRGLTKDSLRNAYNETMARRESRQDKVRAGFFGGLPADVYTVEEKIEYLRRLLSERGVLLFSSILSSCADRSEKVTTFLALLELIKIRDVETTQADVFEDITIADGLADAAAD
jgi:segregation and condensation protein A